MIDALGSRRVQFLLWLGCRVYSPHSSQREPLSFLYSEVFKFVGFFFFFFALKIKNQNSQNIK